MPTESHPDPPVGVVIRRATTDDVPQIKELVDIYAGRILLAKTLMDLYGMIQEFFVAEDTSTGSLIGCGALHVFWSDVGEFRTVAVHPDHHGRKVGHALLQRLLEEARRLHLERVFVLTFEVDFFARHGFHVIEGTPVSKAVYEELLRSYDAGVAEFLDLSSVKPNTLGNTRMLTYLSSPEDHDQSLRKG